MKQFVAGAILTAGLVGNVFSASVGINFSGAGAGGAVYDLSPSVSAGFVAQVNWNNATNNSGDTSTIASPLSGVLVDDSGADSGLTISWSANGAWRSGRPEGLGPDTTLMNGYIDDNSSEGSVSVTISNLNQFSEKYDIIAYFGSVKGTSGTVKGGEMAYGFDSIPATTNAFSASDYVPVIHRLDPNAPLEYTSANYAIYPNLTADSVTVELFRGNQNVGLHAIQVVPSVPKPKGHAIGLNFVGRDWLTVGPTSLNLLPSESAGAVEATTYWNNLTGAVATNNYLYDNNGQNSEVSVAWMADKLSDSGRTNASGDNAMMNGSLFDDKWNGISVSASNVTQFAASYDVYVYMGGEDDSEGRTHVILDGGITNYCSQYSSGSLDFPGDYAPGTTTNEPAWSDYADANYVVFSGLTNDQFTISLENAKKKSSLFGIQIVNTIPPPTGYDAWALLHALEQGAHGDDDGDGYSNIWEYAMEGDPNDDNDWGVSPTSSAMETGGTNWFVYVYPELTDPDHGLIYSLEVAEDLVSNVWTNDGIEFVDSNVVDTLNYITNRVSMEGKPQQFIKLEIDQE